MEKGVAILLVVGGGALIVLAWSWLFGWHRWRHTRGPCLWRRVVPLPRHAEEADVVHAFTATRDGILFDPLESHVFEPGLVAFRESAWTGGLVRYPPLMVGLVRIDPIRREAAIEGRIEWFSAATSVVVVIFALAAFGGHGFVAAVVTLSASCIVFALQATRFAALAERIQRGPRA
jgi:hypothetical protein